jgi:hypothetical protein
MNCSGFPNACGELEPNADIAGIGVSSLLSQLVFVCRSMLAGLHFVRSVCHHHPSGSLLKTCFQREDKISEAKDIVSA